MTIVLENIEVPETKDTFEIRQTVNLNVTATEAQKIAGRWLRDEVAFRLTPTAPTLVVCNERTVWRVPAMYTAPQLETSAKLERLMLMWKLRSYIQARNLKRL